MEQSPSFEAKTSSANQALPHFMEHNSCVHTNIHFNIILPFTQVFYDAPGAHPASYTMGTGSFPGLNGQGVEFTTHSHPAPRLKKE
jgi:hypothetical protein